MDHGQTGQRAHQLENCDLHHTLVEVCWFIFYDLHSDDFVGLHVLTFHDLSESSLSENIQNQVPCRGFAQRCIGRVPPAILTCDHRRCQASH